MKINAKFYRREGLRAPRSDRSIFWSAIAAAVAAHLVFWGILEYRSAPSGVPESGSAVTMLSADDFRGEARRGFRSWLEYHDPRNSGLDTAELLAGWIPAPPRTECAIPVRRAAVGKFRAVPGKKPAERTLLPVPARPAAAPETAAPAPVTDECGNALELGGVALPFRTKRAVQRTVLRVLKTDRNPVLLLERSCGDDALDGFAIRELPRLAAGKTAPEFIVVEWPEARK